MVYINARCRQALRILLNRNGRLTMEQLSKELNVSKRSAYYDVCRINVWLEQSGLAPLDAERGRGLWISAESREPIERLLSEQGTEEMYIFSPEERAKVIVLYLVSSPEPVFIEQLADCCEVSRNTVFSDLKNVSEQLKKYDIALDYQSKSGYALTGDTVRVRALFILYFREMLPLYRDGILKFLDRERIQGYLSELREIERELGLEYVDGAVQSIAALLPVMVRGKDSLEFSAVRRGQLQETKEYRTVRAHFPELSEDESAYLTLHLLGSQINISPEDWMESASQQEIADMARALVSEFERIACVNFDSRRALEQALALHLKTSLYRYQYGIQIGNLFYDDIIKEYPELFSITKAAAKRLEDSIELPIPHEEIACLALHFGAFLKVGETKNERLRILIVCVNGVSTGNMIRREVSKLLPDAEIVGVTAATDMRNAQNICNLIVSTIRVNSVVPVITVHPVLTEFDRNAILSHRLVAPKLLAIQRNRIFDVVKKYVSPSQHAQLLADLTACLQGTDAAPEELPDNSGLLSILDDSRVSVFASADSWRKCIRMAGKPLLDNGSIRKEYLDTIISQIDYYGPYMFLTDRVILAHAKPESGVNRLDIALSVFRKPVVFTETRRASVVITLAAEDQEKHLKILQDILALLSSPDSADKFASCETSGEVLRCVRELLERTEEN